MNPLTLVKRIQNINKKEASLGLSEEASWHAKYKDSAYVYVGGIPYDLTEGDLLAIFAQYGEIVDVNLIRDKGTGKSKGFAFVAYEDQRSTNLAVDNLNGAQILGRIIRVDHVSKYKKLEEEDEETRQRKREERGVCRAFQSGKCDRGDNCKFSHDGQRAANTGWGPEEERHSTFVQDNSRRLEKDTREDLSNRRHSRRSDHKRIDEDEEKKDMGRHRSHARDDMNANVHGKGFGKKHLDEDNAAGERNSHSRTEKWSKSNGGRDRKVEKSSRGYESKSDDQLHRYGSESYSRKG